MKLIYVLTAILLIVSAAAAEENYLVHSIYFVGNKSFSDGELRNVMLTSESPSAFFRFTYKIFHVGGPPVYFDPINLKVDSQRVWQFYRDNGFFNATVSTSLKFNEEDKSVDIYINIKEGRPAYVGAVNYHGVDDSSKNFIEQLKDKPLVVKGNRYSAKAVNAEAVRIISLLQNDGYAYARWDSSVVSDALSDSVNIRASVDFYFSSGRKILLGEVVDSISR